MAANFAPPPPLAFRALRLQPELIPVTSAAGSFTAGVGGGLATLTGTLVSQTLGQGFGVGVGQGLATGAQSALNLGQVQGFNVGANLVNAFGYNVSLGAASSPIIVPPAAIAPFAPAFSELGLDAWERLGMQSGELTVTHLNSMRRSMNLTLVRWANNGLNLWEITNTTLTLVAGQATYTLPSTIIEVLDTYVSVGATGSDIIVTPMSRNTYAALPNKNQPGRPILYWFNRQITPTLTVWPVPDTSTTYTLKYFAWNQIADADPASGNTGQLPYRFLEAFTACVATHLSMKWKPERAQALKAYSDEVFAEAADEDHESTTFSMIPDFGAYFS